MINLLKNYFKPNRDRPAETKEQISYKTFDELYAELRDGELANCINETQNCFVRGDEFVTIEPLHLLVILILANECIEMRTVRSN